jgi:hypothetical protein
MRGPDPLIGASSLSDGPATAASVTVELVGAGLDVVNITGGMRA